VTSRGCTHESVGRGRCIVGVKQRGKNRRRWVDGQRGGGSDDVTNRVCDVGGVKERSEGVVVVDVKKVDEDDDEGCEDVIDIHGGRIGGCPL